jgi:hypothetical protein
LNIGSEDLAKWDGLGTFDERRAAIGRRAAASKPGPFLLMLFSGASPGSGRKRSGHPRRGQP